MQTRTVNCQNCRRDFVIDEYDFGFYEKMEVLPPTFCRECRAIRRMLWRNERVMYKRKCAATGKDIVAIFAPEKPYTVYNREYWWSDAWDPKSYGRDYDFSKPFFQQFYELMQAVPLPAVANTNCVRSDYGNHNADCKDCYQTFASWKNEFVHHSDGMVGCNNSLDCYKSTGLEKCYGSVLCDTGYQVHFSYMADQSTNSTFLDHSRGMNDCFGCVNMRGKSHCFFNEQLSVEEYKKRLSEIDLGSHIELERYKRKFEEFTLKFPKRFANNIKAYDCTGDYILGARNCRYSFDVRDACEDCKYVMHVSEIKDSYDVYGGGMCEMIYEGVDVGISAGQYIGAVLTHGCHAVRYTYNCHYGSHFFGCVGVRGGKYFILNKQYTKEEYEKMVPKIVAHMREMPYVDKSGKTYGFGEFFPAEIAPFAYNETIAIEYFPIEKKDALAHGYSWREPDTKHYDITMPAKNLPDHVKNAPDEIVKEIIGCAHAGKCNHMCATAFRLYSEELAFLKNNNIALPRLCPNCRHFERLAKRTPMQLWHRTCMCSQEGHGHKGPCPNEFKTSYSPKRPEVIYCEQCYQQEVI